MATCPSSESIVEAAQLIKANGGKIHVFTNGSDTQTVQLGYGDATPVLRNVVRQMLSAASEIEGTDASGKFVVANGSSSYRNLASRFADVVNVRDFGAIGDGATDDTEAIQAAMESAAEQGKGVWFPQGHSWAVSRLTVPDGSMLIADHAAFVHDGSSYFLTNAETGATTFYPVFSIGSNVTIGALEIVFPQTQDIPAEIESLSPGGMTGIVVLGDNFHADELSFVYNPSEAETDSSDDGQAAADNSGVAAYGFFVLGSNSYIGFVNSKNIHRPICYGEGSSDGCSNVFLGGYRIEAYKRALKFKGVSGAIIGSGIAKKRPANIGAVQNGWNGILFEECENIAFSSCEIDDAPEHGIRFGGQWNKNVKFGDVVLKRNGGSAIKLNSHDPLEPDRQCSENIAFGNVSIYDNRYVDPDDDIELTRRGEIIRLSHANSVTFASISCFADIVRYTGTTSTAFTGTTVIAVNNVSKLYINSTSTENYSGTFFHINETNDVVAADQNASNFITSDIYLNNVNIKDSEATSRNFISCTLSKSSIDGILFEINSDTFNRYIFACPNTTDGSVSNIILTGNIHSGDLRYPDPVYYLDKIWLDLTLDRKKVTGPASSSLHYLVSVGSASHFDPSVNGINGSMFIGDLAQAGETLTFGGAVNFSKPGSGGRRGAAIAAMQTGSEARSTGLAVFTCTGSTSNNAFSEGFVFSHLGNFHPYVSLAGSLGDPNYLWANIYSQTSSIGSSDARMKTDVQDVDEALMRAWGKVRFKMFRFTASVEEKSQNARVHVGVIAQEVQEAFAAEGLNASSYGLFCYDSWEEQERTVSVVDEEAVYDEAGNEVSSAKTHLETRTIPAGDAYGIRYAEALALECAYQRWLGEELAARIAALEASLNG